MRRQTLIALGIAVVLGLVAVYLANIFLTRTEERVAATPIGTTKVAVASMPLDYGVELTPDKVRFADYPTASLPPGSYATMNALLPLGKRRVALRPIMVNEPILASKLSGEGQNASIALLLPDGKRAAAVRVNDVSGVAGFIQPNNSVDVFVTRAATAATGGGSQVTDVLLQNVKVIATDQNAKDANGQPVLAKTLTLEVDPTDAQKIALAQQIGTLSLVLRKPGEMENNMAVRTVSLNDLRYGRYSGTANMTQSAPAMTVARPRSSPRPAVRRQVVVVPVRPTTNNVQVVRGTEGKDYEVGQYGS